jgi:hypothetical protein
MVRFRSRYLKQWSGTAAQINALGAAAFRVALGVNKNQVYRNASFGHVLSPAEQVQL